MTVTVALNVLLDVFQKREPHYAASARVLSLVADGSLTGVVPAHAFTTLYYIVRKHASKPEAEAALDQMLRHFQPGNLDRAGWTRARELGLADFEDGAVAAVAEVTGSVLIITRNGTDFAGSPVAAIAPADFLSQFALC